MSSPPEGTASFEVGARAPSSRRAYPRLEAAIYVEVQTAGSPEAVRGVTLNLSRGGMLANLEGSVAVGEECLIRFPSPGTELPLNRKTCPQCGYLYPAPFVPGQTIKGHATRVRDRAGVTTAAFGFAILLEVAEE